MLKLVTQAGIPLIGVTTRDTVNIASVLSKVTGQTVMEWEPQGQSPKEGQIYYFVIPEENRFNVDYVEIHNRMAIHQASLILVNVPKPSMLMFDAGEIPVPKSLMVASMAIMFSGSDDPDSKEFKDAIPLAEKLMPSLGGLTIKEAVEYARLAAAQTGQVTAASLAEVRSQFFQGTAGLTNLSLKQHLYIPQPGLMEWINREKDFFLHGDDQRLWPRGLLMDGLPGTGKTEASRFIASQFGVPLFRLDMGGVKNKWLGDSEKNFSAGIRKLDQEEPCIALIDEVEKVFGHTGYSGDTIATMLSQLLWWLAERRTRVLVIMTTNDKSALPPELYRDGRIDETMKFNGLNKADALNFAKEVLKTFPKYSQGDLSLMANNILNSTKHAWASNPLISQAEVTVATYRHIKTLALKA